MFYLFLTAYTCLTSCMVVAKRARRIYASHLVDDLCPSSNILTPSPDYSRSHVGLLSPCFATVSSDTGSIV